jgi:pimeloyl-ACP methyl ester carboxylesterase
MPRVALPEGVSIHCAIDDYLWPWDDRTPVLMMHGFARNASFWNRWVPAIADTYRIYRPDLLGCGLSDRPRRAYEYTHPTGKHRHGCPPSPSPPGSRHGVREAETSSASERAAIPWG